MKIKHWLRKYYLKNFVSTKLYASLIDLRKQVEECGPSALDESHTILGGPTGGDTNYPKKGYAKGLAAKQDMFHII